MKNSGRIPSLVAPHRSDVTILTLTHETDQRSDFQVATLLFTVWSSTGTLLVTWSLRALFFCRSTMVFCLENWRHRLLNSMSQLLIIVDGNKHSLAFFVRQFTWNLVKKLQKPLEGNLAYEWRADSTVLHCCWLCESPTSSHNHV